jgi:hypothetical protein
VCDQPQAAVPRQACDPRFLDIYFGSLERAEARVDSRFASVARRGSPSAAAMFKLVYPKLWDPGEAR